MSFEKIFSANLLFQNSKLQIGYARVSTQDQNADLQSDALTAASCEKIFYDVASSAKSERQGLIEAVEFVHEWKDENNRRGK